jgi:peptidoglycan/LPS O-acetylase OafA/YrhL
LYLNRGDWTPSFAWDALALSLWPLVWYPGEKTLHILLPFVIVVLYVAAFRGRICSAMFSTRAITNIGGMCYSIYLFHFPAVYAVKHITAYWHVGSNFWVFFAMQCCLILPVVMLVCGTFFLIIERPCMDEKWPSRLWSQFETASLVLIPSRLQLQKAPVRQSRSDPEQPTVTEVS